MAELEPIERHSSPDRIIHWTHTLFMALLLATGWGIYSGGYFFSDFATNLSIHMISGFGIIIVSILLTIYFWILDRDEFRLTLITPTDIIEFLTIALNFLGLTKKYPEFHVWDSKRKKYIKKYHPALKMIHWGDMVMIIVMAITGFGLYYGRGSALGFLSNYWSVTLMRTVHLASFFYFVFALMAHLYLSLIPANFHIVKSMINGKDTGEDTIRR
jgi:cytochrome b subunit of formate dehydrogenase